MRPMETFPSSENGKAAKGSLSFPKEEKLRLRSLVENLFREGKSFYDFPLRLILKSFREEDLKKIFKDKVPEGIAPLQMMVTVPKKKRKRAVDRVLMRRRIREAYRLNRISLREICKENPDLVTLSLSFIYIHTDNLPYSVVEEKMIRLLQKAEKVLTTSEKKDE